MLNTISRATAAAGLALALALTGCSATPAPPATPDVTTQPDGPADQSNNDAPTGEFMIDPAFPWPADTPRPNNIFGEFSGKNPFGEGAVRSIEFTASMAEAQAYVDSVVAAGWEHMMGTAEPMVDDAGASASWILVKGGVTGTISTENGNDATPQWTFAMLG